MASPGAVKLQRLRDRGYTEQQISAYQAQVNQRFDGKYTPEQIDAYWGQSPVTTPEVDRAIHANVERNWTPADAKPANNAIEALAAGWDMSVTSLLQHAPKTVLPQHAGLGMQIAAGIGTFVGDLPATLIGGFSGGAAGAAVTAETGPGAIVGATVGVGAGSAALPEAMREVAMDHYRNGTVTDANDFLTRSASIAWGTTKAGTIGAISMLVGGTAGKAVLGVGIKATAEEVAAATASGSLVRRGAAGTAEAVGYAATATTVGAGLEGRMPNSDDFYSATVMVLGLKAAGGMVGGRFKPSAKGEYVAENMRQVYEKTGIPPWEQAKRAKEDPALAAEIMGRSPDGKVVYLRFQQEAPEEPEPYKPRAVEPTAPPVGGDAVEHGLKAVEFLENSKGFAKRHGISENDVVSPAGAVGKYQIMPKTAQQYMGKGFDVRTLRDPEVNRTVAEHIMADLTKRYTRGDGTVDWEAVYIAYNAGPGRADRFIQNGRDFKRLPVETQRYLERADNAGWLKGPEGAVEKPPLPEGTDYASWKPEELEQSINSIIAEPDRPSLLSNGKSLIDSAYTRYVSRLGPFRALDKELGVEDTQVGFKDVYRNTAASSDRAGHFLTSGAIDPVTYERLSNESYVAAYDLAKKNGGTADGFTAYRLAQSAIEEEKRGIKTGVDVDQAKALVAQTGATYEAAAQMVNRVKNGVLDYYAKAGMLNETRLAALKEREYHIPLQREGGEEVRPQGGKGYQARQVLKRRTGSTAKITEPIYNEIANIHRLVANADRNLANMALVRVDPALLEALGIRKAGEETLPDLPSFEDVLSVQEGLARHGDKGFTVFIDGKAHTYTVDNPEIAELIRGGSPADIGTLTGVARWFATIQRSGITALPDYLAKMVIRDQFTAPMVEKFGGIPFQNLLVGATHVMRKTEVFYEFIRNGGMGAALADMDARYIRRDVDTLFKHTGVTGSVINSFKNPIEASRVVMERIDAMSRVGAFVRQKQAGVTSFKAAMKSREMYLDFADRGTSQVLNWWAGITPFLRPTILGIDQLVRAGVKDPLGVTARSAAYITVPSLSLLALNLGMDDHLPDKEKYVNLPPWLRDLYWITPPVGGERIYIPKPRELGLMFGSLPERAVLALHSHDRHAFDGWAEDFLSVFWPNLIPAGITPVGENVTDTSFFGYHRLIPTYLEDASNYMQYTPATSRTAVALANVLGPEHAGVLDVSPIVIDNYVKQWTGGVGKLALRALDAPYKIWNYRTQPPSQLADIPIVGSFLVRHEQQGLGPIETFYQSLDEVRKAHKDFDLAVGRLDDSQIDFTSQNAAAYLDLLDEAKTLSDQRNVIEAINRDETMTAEEKRQRADEIVQAMIAIAKVGTMKLDVLKEAEADQTGLAGSPAPAQPAAPSQPAAPPPVGENRGMVPVS